MVNARHSKAGRFVQQRLFSGLSAFTELEQRIADLPDEKSRGDAFEVFAQAYLATQLVHQAREVWPCDKMPPSLQQRLRLPLKDMGVDGLLVTTSEELACYQVKFRVSRPALTWTELSTFFGLADVGARRLVFTNCDDITSVAESRQGAVFVRGSDLDRLTTEDFRIIEAWIAGCVAPRGKKPPKPHQDAALKDILYGLTRHPRATALMACGSGKTLVALWTAERLNARTVLVLLPSLALVRQTLHEWLHETNWPEVEYRCVCSDPTVQLEEDALVVRPSELDFPVTTESSDLRRFLERQTGAVRIVFSTYHSAHAVAEATAGLPPFDLGVFDEAHKTAGREGMKFTLALNDGNLPIARRLFLTATPRHYDVAPRDKTGEGRIVLSMDVPEIYGPVVHRLPFSTAAKLGIITDYKVLISIVTSDMVTDELLRRGVVLVEGEEIKARQVANQIALKSAIEKHGISRVFTFHSKVDAAKSFTCDGPEGIATHLPGFHCAHINGAMSVAYRKRLMDEFAAAPRAILSNARCLTEGVDVPAVDMVAFLSPRRSLVDIVQATGRAMRLSPGKKLGYVLVPLYVEKARGETIEEAVKRSDYDEVWNVLRQLQEHDDLLAQIISEMRIERGTTGGYDDTRFRERVEFLGPAVSLDTLRNSITAACLDALGEAWFERYGQLVAYHEQHGNCDMPARWRENQKLATWVVNQRVNRRDGVLEDEKIALLDRIGFKWNPKVSLWRTRYLALLEHRQRFGDCLVPQGWPENKKLATWVSSQRLLKSRGKLSQERVAMLEKIGFEWSPGATWDDRFAELCAFKAQVGHTRVPARWAENLLLGQWAVDQRYRRRRGELRKDFEERLNSIGFEWEIPREPPSLEDSRPRLDALRAYKTEHGDLAVSRHDEKYPGLAEWMTHQRMRFKKGRMPDDLKRELNEIGFPWTKSSDDGKWAAMLARFKDYASVHGAGRITIVDEATRKLKRWFLWQRQARKRGELSDPRIRALEEVGFVWEAPRISNSTKVSTPQYESHWLEMFAQLKEYAAAHGISSIEVVDAATRKLNRWMLWQRQARKLGKLSDARIQALDGIGFVWQRVAKESVPKPKPIPPRQAPEIPQRSWDEWFSDLADFFKLHGHCNVPADWQANPALAVWVGLQRSAKRRNRLTEDQLRRMDEIGFAWSIHDGDWDAMFAELVEHLRPMHNGKPRNVAMNVELRRWTLTQRQLKKRRELEPEREHKLNSIGFEWQPFSKQWQAMLETLRKFRSEHQHCRVPSKWPRNPKLASWVATQRARKASGILSAERIAALDALGFSWRVGSSDRVSSVKAWEAAFEMLKKYKGSHGNCLVPQRFKENRRLADWVSEQRIAHNKGRLEAERMRRLEELGFDWNPVSTKWEEMFQQLVQFKQEHGHANVPQRSGKYAALGTWVRNQRGAKRDKRPIMVERTKRLDEVGFMWTLIESPSE